MKRVLLLFVVLLSAVVGRACSCGSPGRVCGAFGPDTIIFRGTVIERTLLDNVHAYTKPDGTQGSLVGGGRYRVRFAVQENLNGASAQERVVYTAWQTSACGFPFQDGRQYIVFTTVNRDDGQLWASRCSLTEELQPGVANASLSFFRGRAAMPPGGEIFGSMQLRQPSTPPPAFSVTLTGPQSKTLAVDRDGLFHAAGLAPGTYTVATRVPSGYSADETARQLTVADRACVETHFYVSYNGRVSGRVIDQEGHPVADQGMLLKGADPGEPKRYDLRATTDAQGRYSFPAVSPGTYLIAADRPGMLTDTVAGTLYYPQSATPQEAQRVEVGFAATVDAIDFVLPKLRPTVTVRVRVRLPDAAPGAGLKLFAFQSGTRRGATITATTDRDGVATLAAFDGRSYSLNVALDGEHMSCADTIQFTAKDGEDLGVLQVKDPKACGH